MLGSRFAFLLFAALAFVSSFAGRCTAETPPPLDTFVAETFTVEGGSEEFTQQLTSEEPTPGVRVYTLKLTADKPAVLKPMTVKFNFPSADINGYWNANMAVDKIRYYRSGFTSGAAGVPPVHCYYNNGLTNRITYAASDALNTLKFFCNVREKTVRFYAGIELFTERRPAVKTYSVKFRIDTRDIPYYEALDDVRAWWDAMPEYQPTNVPDLARRPLYSTWYSYHQEIDSDTLIKECRLARELGCYAIIVDDGWQTTDSSRGYAYTGDWQPQRLTPIREFVRRAHAEDVKVMLWYSLPFVGVNSEAYQRFQGKYLFHWKGQGAYVLDPRYPEVREYLISTYEKALAEWNLDGFKLDFIGMFKARGNTVLTAEDGRDFASIADATDHLMMEIIRRLKAQKPDVLIEFRQPYTGPVMRKYGNMLRGTDCPNNAATNRNEIASLRLLAGSTAVHSDMFIWRPEEPTHGAALQLLNILFSVPQVSVRLEEISPEHREMVRFWLGYWNENREVLLDGKYVPGNPGANYPSLSGVGSEKQITALYDTPAAQQLRPGLKALDVVNATGKRVVYVDLTEDWGKCLVTTYDTSGKASTKTTTLGQSVHRFETPLSGMVQIRRAE